MKLFIKFCFSIQFLFFGGALFAADAKPDWDQLIKIAAAGNSVSFKGLDLLAQLSTSRIVDTGEIELTIDMFHQDAKNSLASARARITPGARTYLDTLRLGQNVVINKQNIELRRRGIGAFLFKWIAKQASRHNSSSMYWSPVPIGKNPLKREEVIAFYVSLGAVESEKGQMTIALQPSGIKFADQQLFDAARSGDIARVKEFIANSQERDSWQEALLTAAYHKQWPVVDLFLEQSLRLDTPGKFYDGTMTILEKAADECDDDLIKQLLTYPHVDVKQKTSDESCLHRTVMRDFECTELLLAAKANVNDVDKNLQTPLHELAVRFDNVEAGYKPQLKQTMLLLIESKADLNARNSTGRIPAYFVSSPSIKKLLQAS